MRKDIATPVYSKGNISLIFKICVFIRSYTISDGHQMPDISRTKPEMFSPLRARAHVRIEVFHLTIFPAAFKTTESRKARFLFIPAPVPQASLIKAFGP